MQTALPVDLDTGDWQDTSIGLKYSHTFGYGKIDSWATIEAAKTFKNVKPQSGNPTGTGRLSGIL
jgi:kexin